MSEINRGYPLIVSIDGIDGSGKETTSKLVNEMLQERGVPTLVVSPPFYDEPSGQMIKKILTAPKGAYEFPTRRMISSLYEMDRNVWMAQHVREFSDYKVILYNRSWLSNLFYQTSTMPSSIYLGPTIPSNDKGAIYENMVEHMVAGYLAEIKPWFIPVISPVTGEPLYRSPMADLPIRNYVLETDLEDQDIADIIMEGIVRRGTPDANENIMFLSSVWENIVRLYDRFLNYKKYRNDASNPHVSYDWMPLLEMFMSHWNKGEFTVGMTGETLSTLARRLHNCYNFSMIPVFEREDNHVARRTPEKIATDIYTSIMDTLCYGKLHYKVHFTTH